MDALARLRPYVRETIVDDVRDSRKGHAGVRRDVLERYTVVGPPIP